MEYTLSGADVFSLVAMQPTPSAYFGNPNNGLDSTQPFAYVNLVATSGTVFNTVVFSNARIDSGFESDNHSVGLVAPTPEPGIFALLSSLSVTSIVLVRRRYTR